jgi:hypothetical protein
LFREDSRPSTLVAKRSPEERLAGFLEPTGCGGEPGYQLRRPGARIALFKSLKPSALGRQHSAQEKKPRNPAVVGNPYLPVTSKGYGKTLCQLQAKLGYV